MEGKAKKPFAQIPSANEDVLEETMLELAVPKHLIREVVNVQSEYTAERIREGGFEGVLWPLFGKVKVKVAKVRTITEMVGNQNIKKNTQIR